MFANNLVMSLLEQLVGKWVCNQRLPRCYLFWNQDNIRAIYALQANTSTKKGIK
jgi:hypothetical protein